MLYFCCADITLLVHSDRNKSGSEIKIGGDRLVA